MDNQSLSYSTSPVHVGTDIQCIIIDTQGTHTLTGTYQTITLLVSAHATIHDRMHAETRTIRILPDVSCTYIQYDTTEIPTIHDHIYIEKNSMLQAFYVGTHAHPRTRSLHIYTQAVGAQAYITGAYNVTENAHVDIHTYQYHHAPQTTSMLHIRKIIHDCALVTYQGLVHIAPNAMQSNASQQDRTLLASTSARTQSTPALEVCTQDVQCSHGSAVATIDDGALWYLQSRGLCTQQATLLLHHAFFVSLFTSLDQETYTHIYSLLHNTADEYLSKPL